MRLYLDDLQFAADRPSQGFSVGGSLYVSVAGAYFPSENWYDMVCFDLKNWIPGLVSFGLGHADSCVLAFMDGPYTIRLERTSDNTIQANCLRDSVSVVPKLEIKFSRFVRSVVSCCGKYDKFLMENGKSAHFLDEIKLLKTILIFKTQENTNV